MIKIQYVFPVNLDCNFESDANAWCNWINKTQSAQQDWKLNKGKTRSSNTGPSVDHTTNTDQGTYILFFFKIYL